MDSFLAETHSRGLIQLSRLSADLVRASMMCAAETGRHVSNVIRIHSQDDQACWIEEDGDLFYILHCLARKTVRRSHTKREREKDGHFLFYLI